jgi:hypothetical protein
MAIRKDALGFGFVPLESQHHFLVMIPRGKNDTVIVYERFKWQEKEDVQKIDLICDRPKVEISKDKWKQVEDDLRVEFNERLKKDGILVGRWKSGQVPVQRLLGKEMVLLLWAIEDCESSVIPMAIKNWKGLSPEERWWLFTMTNAATGYVDDKRGWRKAVRYALTENPIEETKQMSLFDLAIKRKIDD